MTPIDLALAQFSPTDATVRLCTALMAVLPDVPTLSVYRSLQEAALILHSDGPPGLLERATALAASPDVASALRMADALDQGDTGISLSTGMRTAAAWLFGGSTAAPTDAQQRADAAVKALGFALVIAKALSGPPAERVQRFQQLPSGMAVLGYFGAVEVALPFSDEIAKGVGTKAFFVGLLKTEIGSAVPRLLAVTNAEAAAQAQGQLLFLTPALLAQSESAVQHVGALTATIRSYLPAMLGFAKDSLPEVVATGADNLPVYRYLLVRAIAEALLVRARLELEPGWGRLAAVATPGTPVATAEIPGDNPFAAPFGGEAGGSVANQNALADTNPFATPFSGETALPVSNQNPPATVAENPFAAPFAAASPVPLVLPALGATDTIHGELDAVVRRIPIEDVPLPPRPAPVHAPLEGPVEPLSGHYVAIDGAEALWLIFWKDGRFASEPLAGVDFAVAQAQGRPTGTYRHAAGQLVVLFHDGRELSASVTVEPYALIVDGKRLARADFDLSGGYLDGTYTGVGGAWSFSSDGRVSHGTAAGAYVLGKTKLELRWDDGRSEQLSLLTDVQPTAEQPAVIWLGPQRLDRITSEIS